MKNTIIDELNNTGYVYRDNEDGTFDVCYDHDQDANFTGVNMFHVATVKEEGDLWCVNGNEGAGWGEYRKEDWTLERDIYDQCIEEHINYLFQPSTTRLSHIDNMEKDYIKQLIRESATKVCQTLNALQAIERQFNDNLVDDNGKNVEAEYYALYNAIASLKSAYEDIKDI